MTKKIKVGIIGCGKVADLHAMATKKIDNAELLAACDLDKTRAEGFASKYSINAYISVAGMIEKEQLDMVCICTPHPVHKAPAIEALNAGAHVLIEKPLASSLEDCDAMLEAAKLNKKQIGMVSQRRFYSPCLRLKTAIENGKIGTPVLGTIFMFGWRDKPYYDSDPWRGTWKGEGGGVLVNQAPHQLDLLQWFMGSEVDELYGISDNLNHPYIEVEDTAVAVVRFKNGGLANIVVSNSQKPGIYGKVHIHGSNGASVGVQTDGGAMFVAGMSNILEPPVNDLWTVPGEENLLEGWVKDDSDSFNAVNPMEFFHGLQVQDFVNAILENREPLISGREGRKTVELFTAIYRSTRDNQPIKFPLSVETGRNDFDGRLSNK